MPPCNQQVRRSKRPTPRIYTLFLLNSFMHLMGKNLVQDWYCLAKTTAEKAAWDFAETHNLNLKWQSVHQSQWGLCCNHLLTKAVPIFSNTSMVILLCALVRWYCTLDTRFEHICNTIFLEDFLLLQFTQDALYFSLTANITEILPPTLQLFSKEKGNVVEQLPYLMICCCLIVFLCQFQNIHYYTKISQHFLNPRLISSSTDYFHMILIISWASGTAHCQAYVDVTDVAEAYVLVYETLSASTCVQNGQCIMESWWKLYNICIPTIPSQQS